MTTLLISSASALISHRYTLGKLWEDAAIVARAEVIKSSSHKEGHRIFTRYHLKVNELYQYKLIDQPDFRKDKLIAHLPGGESNGIKQSVPGIPFLRQGKEYIFFLRCPSYERCVPLGYGQGLWIRQESAETWRSIDEAHKQGPFTLEQLLSQRGRAVHVNESQGLSPPNVAQP